MNLPTGHDRSAAESAISSKNAEPLLVHEVMLVEALQEYRAALDQGRVIDRITLLAKYPQIADELAACLDSVDFIERIAPQVNEPADVAQQRQGSPVRPLATLGDFRISREIGRGGMGVVYEAEQLSLGRRVALKVLPFAAVLDSSQLQRFKNEAQAAAMLKHPNIVSVYSVGCERGVHYYAMEYVEGQSLAEAIEQARSGIEESGDRSTTKMTEKQSERKDIVSADATGSYANTVPEVQAAITTVRATSPVSFFRSAVRLVIDVAEALEHAHQNGVVHRDIKPSNLLLGTRGDVWITDFGLAQVQSEGNLTMSGDVVGTLRYMSPEQATGNRGLVDHRTDIYALGITLYELLTLKPAFGHDGRQELLKHVMEDDPLPPRKLEPRLPKDLETIVLQAIAKEPTARYATAQELADDLRRFLLHQPIRARRATVSGRLWRWCRRNPLVAGLVACLAAVLSLLAVVGPVVAVKHRGLARSEANSRRLAETARQQAELRLYTSDINSAYKAWQDGSVARVQELLSRHVPRTGQIDRRGFEWHLLSGRLQRSMTAPRLRHRGLARIAFSADGALLASASWEGTVKVFNRATHSPEQTIIHGSLDVQAVAFSPDGTLLASAGLDRTVKLWDVATGTLRHTFQHDQEVASVAFSPDSHTLVCGCGTYWQGEIKIWDVNQGELMETLSDQTAQVSAVDFSPDGTCFASASFDRTVIVWDAETHRNQATLVGHTNRVTAIAFSPDGQILASSGWDGSVKLWDVASWKLRQEIDQSIGQVYSLSFSSSGDLVAVAGQTSNVWIWHLETNQVRPLVTGHSGRVESVAFIPGSSILATGSVDGTIKLQNVTPVASPQIKQLHGDWWTRIAVSAKPEPLIAVSGAENTTQSRSGELAVWNLESNKRRAFTGPSQPPLWSVAFSSDGRILAAGSGTDPQGNSGHDIRLWDMPSGQLLRTFSGHDSAVTAIAFSPNGHVLASGEWGRPDAATPDFEQWHGTIHLWDTSTGDVFRTWQVDHFAPASIAFSPDGQTLAVGGGTWDHGSIKRWNIPTGKPIDTWAVGGKLVLGVAFSPDGQYLASADWSGNLTTWNLANGAKHFSITGHSHHALSVAFAPDGRTLASASWDRTVKLWHVATGDELAALRCDAPVSSVAFYPDGSTLAAGCTDRTVYLWHLDAEESVLHPE